MLLPAVVARQAEVASSEVPCWTRGWGCKRSGQLLFLRFHATARVNHPLLRTNQGCAGFTNVKTVNPLGRCAGVRGVSETIACYRDRHAVGAARLDAGDG